MRTAQIRRTTRETDISLSLCLDGGAVGIQTGIGFFDHMLTALAVHANFGLTVSCQGDLEVDCHHTVEDTGLCWGGVCPSGRGPFRHRTLRQLFYPDG